MNYPKCTVTTIINPGNYIVVSGDAEHHSQVKYLEDKITKEMRHRHSELEYLTTCFNPQSCVAVEVSEKEETLKRGMIEKKIGKGLYEVFLIDSGYFIEVEESKIRAMTNREFVDVEPLSFTVKLYGLVPVKFGFENDVTRYKICHSWSTESIDFVKEVLKLCREIRVRSIFIQKRTVYGDLYVKHKSKDKFISLRKWLCNQEYCVYSEKYALKKVLHADSVNYKDEIEAEEEEQKEEEEEECDLKGFLDNNCLALEGSMDGVQKWLAENNEELKKNTYELDLQPVSPQIKESNLENSCILLHPDSGCTIFDSIRKRKMVLKDVPSDSDKSFDSLKNGVYSESGEQFPKGNQAKKGMGRGKLLQLGLSLKNKKIAGKITNKEDVQTSSESKTDDFYSLKSFDSLSLKKNFRTNLRKEISDVGNNSSNDQTEFQKAMSVVESSTKEGIPVSKTGRFKRETTENYDKPPKSVGTASRKTNSLEDRRSRIIQRGTSIVKSKLRDETSKFHEGLWKENSSRYWTPFVLFRDSSVEPVNKFQELPIEPSVIKNLKREGVFNALSPIQRWAIPAIRKQHNVVIIGGPETGKTLSYIVSLMDFIQDETNFEELPDGNGPYIVILCSSSLSCEYVYFMSHILLGNYTEEHRLKSKIKIILGHGGGREKEVWVRLTNGCDILISTPHCLERLLEMPVLTNFARLTCLVLDEIDIISKEPFRNSMEIILEKAKFCSKNRYYQSIVCGEKWTPHVESLVESYVKSYALIIGSYLEAAIYSRLKPKICIVNENQKPDILLDKIKDVIGLIKILIVCEKSSDAIFLDNFLSEKGIHSLVAHEHKLANDFNEIRSIWKTSTQHQVLISTDGVLNELKIRDVETLIHYSLPDKSKTNFFLRYSTFLESWINAKKNFQDSSTNKKLTDIVFIDDESHHQVPHIVDFVLRLGGNVPAKVLEKCDEIWRQIEIGKTDRPICTNLLAFGCCRTTKNCPRRHAFLKSLDSPINLPTRGWVNFMVLKVHDPCSFSARLLEHVDEKGKKSKIDDQFLSINVKLAKFFESEDNRRAHGLPNVGDICAIKSEILGQDVFHRAQVVEFVKLDKYNQPVEANVRLMDRGDVQIVRNFDLYELPEELSKHPPTAVEVRLAGIQPVDFDLNWSRFAITFAKNLLTRNLEEDQYWSGKIVLSLNNILFLEPIKLKRFLPSVNTHVSDVTLQEELLVNRMAVRNTDHLSRILKFCAEGGIPIPEPEETEEKVMKVPQPQWAVFEDSFVRVKFLAAENTSTVFLQPKKFEKLLADLEADCQEEAAKTKKEIQSPKRNKPAAPKLSVGMFCLAIFEESWNRGRIESENEENFYVFFVDHGDFYFVAKKDVIPISQTLLMRLPCQAIECNLVGIKSEKECLPEVLDELYDFSEDGKGDLYAYIINKDLKPEITSGRKYSLNLLNLHGVSLNKALTEGEKVSVEESEREFLEDIEIGASDIENESVDGGEEKEEDKNGSEDEKEEEVPETLYERDVAACFTKMSDDLFEEESARLFLEEFFSKILPQSVRPSQTANSEENKKPTVSHNTKSENKSGLNEESKSFQSEDKQAIVEKGIVANFNRLKLNLQKKRMEKDKEDLQLRSEENVLCPQVLWCQDYLEVQLKVMLTDVKDYRLDCSVTNLLFRCVVDNKVYEVDLKLYGAISPQLTSVTLKAHHVAIKLKKLCFPLWPRLQMDEGKLPWIIADVESIVVKENFFSDEIESVKRNVEAGILKEGIRDEKIFWCSDSDNDYLSEDSKSD